MGSCLGKARKLRDDLQTATTSSKTATTLHRSSSTTLPNSVEHHSALTKRSFSQSVRNGRILDVRQDIEERGADPLGVLKMGTLPLRTAVVLACWFGHDEEFVRLLLFFEPKNPPRAEFLKDFALACQMIPLEYIILLVEYFGSEIVKNSNYYYSINNNNKNPRSGSRVVSIAMTPLHYAFSRGNVHVIRYLLCQGADLTQAALSNHSTPLHCLAVRSCLTYEQRNGNKNDMMKSNSNNQKGDKDDNDAVATLDWIIMAGFADYLLLENRFGKTALEAILFHATSVDVMRTCIIWLCCHNGGVSVDKATACS